MRVSPALVPRTDFVRAALCVAAFFLWARPGPVTPEATGCRNTTSATARSRQRRPGVHCRCRCTQCQRHGCGCRGRDALVWPGHRAGLHPRPDFAHQRPAGLCGPCQLGRRARWRRVGWDRSQRHAAGPGHSPLRAGTGGAGAEGGRQPAAPERSRGAAPTAAPGRAPTPSPASHGCVGAGGGACGRPSTWVPRGPWGAVSPHAPFVPPPGGSGEPRAGWERPHQRPHQSPCRACHGRIGSNSGGQVGGRCAVLHRSTRHPSSHRASRGKPCS